MVPWFQFTFLAAAWGGSYLFLRQVAPVFGPAGIAGFRIGVAALVLLPFAWRARRGLTRQWPLVLLSGLLNTALPMGLISWSMKSLHAGHGSIINATAPLFAAVIGHWFFRERQSRRAWLGLFLGLLGVGLTLKPWQAAAPLNIIPALVVLAAMVAYGFGIHVAHRVKQVPAVSNAAGTMVAGFLWSFLPMAWSWPEGEIPTAAWGSGIALGVLSTGLAFVLYYRLLEQWGPSRTATVTYLAPFFGMLWGWWILGEPVEAAWIPGLALVLMGLRLSRA